MKTVGIITMHSVLNYGSVLQAYATLHCIEKLGYQAEIIDYRFPTEYHKSLAKFHKKKEVKDSLWRLHFNGFCSRILGVSQAEKLLKFDTFCKHYLKRSQPYYTKEQLQQSSPLYDIYVTGSDQVWNPNYTGDDTSFLLEWVPNDKRKIAYAASFGIKTLPDRYKPCYKKLLNRYAYISSRESSIILQELTGKPSKVTLDPTFLLGKAEWNKIIPEKQIVKGRYILCYLLRYTFDPFPYADQVISFARKSTGMKVVFIGPEASYIIKGYKVLPNCGPLEFLNLFYYASYVITSSFHGTSFAINFRKDFISIIDEHNSEDNRQVSLIKTLGINKECLIRKNTMLCKNELPHIDYSLYNNTIDGAVKWSMEFLKEALSDTGINSI